MNKKSAITHTPTPWKLYQEKTINGTLKIGVHIAQASLGLAPIFELGNMGVDSKAHVDAAFIVRAVNSHEALLKFAKLAEQWIMTQHYGSVPFLDGLTQAIAQAEGR